jgi:hypothetical protein
MFPLARWQAALDASHREAGRMRMAGLAREAALIDQTLLRSFAPLLATVGDAGGWQRAMTALAQPDAPLRLDAVAGDDFGLASVRVRALLAVPEVEQIDGAPIIGQAISDAIAVGAPTYNEGDARGCGIIYWATALTLVSAPMTRGFSGQVRALRTLRGAVEEAMPPIGNTPAALDDFAWRMRRALDATLDLLR